MRNPIKKRNALLEQLGHCSEFVRGSINSVCATCHRAHCICKRPPSRRVYRLTYKDRRQKSRIVYVPRSQLPRIRKLIANYARLRKLIERLVETNIEIFKEETRR